MSCLISHDEINRSKQQLSEQNNTVDNNTPLINLVKGGLLVQTSIGNIQYGIPPETVKDSLNLGLKIPEYYIVPKKGFD